MTTLALAAPLSDAGVPSIVWAFVLRVVESALPGEVYTYIYRGTQGTTEYVLTPVDPGLTAGADAAERSVILAARAKGPSGSCSFRTLAFRRVDGAWVKRAR